MTNGEAATLNVRGEQIELPLVDGTEGETVVDVSKLRAQTGLVTLDYGFGNTAATKSAVSFVNGEAGQLRYRGYPIEQLAEHCTFLEVAYLLWNGELPTQPELDEFVRVVTRHTMVNEEMRPFFDAFPKGAHPMNILSAATSALSPFYQPALIVRWMLHAGLKYQVARDRAQPVDRIVDEDPASRETIATAVIDALIAERPAFVIANNKAEGSAPLSIFRLAERVADWTPNAP